jgi:hypothetical protein
LIPAATLLAASRGPGPKDGGAPAASGAAETSTRSAPEGDSVGVLASVEGLEVTRDHAGASGAGLAAGRQVFRADAAVLAQAPLENGARVAFKYRQDGDDDVLTALTAR